MKRLLLLLSCALIGCSGPAQPKAPPSSAFLEADLTRYRQSVAAGDYGSALATGQALLRGYPGSAAAQEVERTLPEIEAKAAAATEHERLAGLWAYQTGTESGGAQSAASIFASGTDAAGKGPRLVLRRHAAWGVSAYVYSDGAGFSCGKPCTVGLSFDGGPVESWRASMPATGEPAIFIEDHEQLAARIADADRLEMHASLADREASTLVFDVGGFDPEKWPQLP